MSLMEQYIIRLPLAKTIPNVMETAVFCAATLCGVTLLSLALLKPDVGALEKTKVINK